MKELKKDAIEGHKKIEKERAQGTAKTGVQGQGQKLTENVSAKYEQAKNMVKEMTTDKDFSDVKDTTKQYAKKAKGFVQDKAQDLTNTDIGDKAKTYAKQAKNFV